MKVTGKGSKEARLAAHSAVIEAGNVYLPDPSGDSDRAWVEDYVEELCAFPRGPSDDQADATSQALEYLSRSGPTAVAVFEPPDPRERLRNWW